MAFLKETERSLRTYFIVVGAIGTVVGFLGLRDVSNAPAMETSFLITVALWLLPVARMVLGPAFVIAGVNLPHALERGAPWTRTLVKVAVGVILTEVAVLVALANSLQGADSPYLMGDAMGRAAIPLLILWYIHSSLRRLAAEAQQRVVASVGRKFE